LGQNQIQEATVVSIRYSGQLGEVTQNTGVGAACFSFSGIPRSSYVPVDGIFEVSAFLAFQFFYNLLVFNARKYSDSPRLHHSSTKIPGVFTRRVFRPDFSIFTSRAGGRIVSRTGGTWRFSISPSRTAPSPGSSRRGGHANGDSSSCGETRKE
jgi:hypothetical protein